MSSSCSSFGFIWVGTRQHVPPSVHIAESFSDKRIVLRKWLIGIDEITEFNEVSFLVHEGHCPWKTLFAKVQLQRRKQRLVKGMLIGQPMGPTGVEHRICLLQNLYCVNIFGTEQLLPSGPVLDTKSASKNLPHRVYRTSLRLDNANSLKDVPYLSR